jgi:HEAT repeat protein
MSFRDFITSRLYRKKLRSELDEFNSIRAPSNPSRRYIDKLVRRLLNEKHSRAAQRELELIGPVAAPSLVSALREARYQQEVERTHSMADQPLDLVLGLLVPHSPDEVVSAATPLVRSDSSTIRKIAAIHLASLGREDTVPFLAQLLNDPDGYVRSYVKIGVQRAILGGRCGESFRRRMYDLLLAQCDQEWEGDVNEAAGAVVELDPRRAAEDFATERWLSPSNRYVYKILEACNDAGIALPSAPLRRLLDHSLPQAVGEKCYPHQYVVAATLEALVRTEGDQVKPLLESMLTSDQDVIQELAARGLGKIAGIDDPIGFVYNRAESVGIDGLTAQQRIVYFALGFDAEVCNGGIMQFFGNSSGDCAADTLEALRVLGHAEAFRALDIAMNLVGPLAREPDREMRLAAFEGRFDELLAGFAPLESAYYRTTGMLRQRILLYAVANTEHFRSGASQ